VADQNFTGYASSRGTHLTSFGLSGPSVMREKHCFIRINDVLYADAITTCLFAFVSLHI